jgi:hypothetical protein
VLQHVTFGVPLRILRASIQCLQLWEMLDPLAIFEEIEPSANINAFKRVFFYDLTPEPLQYLIRNHFRFYL